jgi:hypothetical protein
MGSLWETETTPDGIQAGENNINPLSTESTSNSAFVPGAGVAHYPDIGVPAFM